MSEVVVTYYKCLNCDAGDMDRGVNLPAPVALVCYKCHEGGIYQGKRLSPMEQAQLQIGMLRV